MNAIFAIFGVIAIIFILVMFFGEFFKDMIMVIFGLIMMILEESFEVIFANVKSESTATKAACLFGTALVFGFVFSVIAVLITDNVELSVLFGLTTGTVLGVLNVISDFGIDLEARRARPNP